MTTKIIVSLTPEEVSLLQKNVHGRGGFQSLLASLRTKLRGNDLELDLADVERIARYVSDYGDGGFQGRLEGVLGAIRSLVDAVRALL